MKTITLLGRRWFQKTYGNTYHTVTVLIDGKEVFSSPKEYGYDRQYEETGMQWVDASGLVEPRKEHTNGSHEANWQWAERLGIEFHSEAADVSREKDL